MTISLKHAFTNPVADEGNSNETGPDEWNAEHVLTQAAERILGRITGGTGATEELTAAQVRTILGNTTTSTDNAIARFDGTAGAIQNSALTIADTSGSISGFADASFLADSSGNELLIFQIVGSAVNQIDITNAAANGSPSIEATGSDTDIDLIVKGKGTGGVLMGEPGTAQFLIDGATSWFQIAESGSNAWGSSQGVFSADAVGPGFAFAKSRNTTVGSHTVVQSGDAAGDLTGYGSDGTDFAPVARIGFIVDGTPGNDDMPGRIAFSTTADGACRHSHSCECARERDPKRCLNNVTSPAIFIDFVKGQDSKSAPQQHRMSGMG